MKKKCFAIGFTAILLVFAILFCGCKKALSADISEDHAGFSEYCEDLHSPADQQIVQDYPEEGEPFDSTEEEPPGVPVLPLGTDDEQERSQEDPPEDTASAAEPPYTYTEPQNDLTPYLAACAKTDLNVRGGAGTSYKVLFTLGIGGSLPYLWREGEWIAVWTGERVGFMHRNYAFVTETTTALERVIRAGLKKLGTPYLWGATRVLDGAGEPNPAFSGKSFDCSSFVQYCFYVGAGIKLGSYTGSQADFTVGKKIYDYASLKRGDFFFTGSGSISHVVIYLGGGKLLQTYSANGGPVSVTDDDRWRAKFLSGRRPDLTVTKHF